MNVQHKCLFHPANPIVKFCENRQCTLPLCLECQPIHLQEHHSQQSQAKVLRFNEATLKAANNMEDYLEAFKSFERETENKIENDKEIVMKMVDEYYSAARKILNQIRENVNKVTENLNKLNKGSIKALIFYYSGDVKLNKFDIQFEPLQIKIRNVLQKRNDKIDIQPKRANVSYTTSNHSIDQDYQYNQSSEITDKQRTKNLRNVQNQSENVFSNIQEIKQEKNFGRNRKSIFDNSKKGSMVKQNIPTHKESDVKYNNYQPHYEQLLQNPAPSVEHCPKFHYDINYEYKVPEKVSPEPEILSFQNRFLNKFSCAQQADQKDIYQMPTAKEVNRPEVKYDEIFNKKLLKPEDLDVQKQKENNFAARPSQISNTLTQRNRSMSQNNINEKEIRKTNYDYDLKKQVLSPEEIRKMLEKKIQERNRVLSIKKSDNYPMVEEKGRKGWETRDSIINQIYSEPKY